MTVLFVIIYYRSCLSISVGKLFEIYSLGEKNKKMHFLLCGLRQMSHNVKKFARFSFILSWAVIALLFLCGVKIVKNCGRLLMSSKVGVKVNN